jgi:hypothetical protein
MITGRGPFLGQRELVVQPLILVGKAKSISAVLYGRRFVLIVDVDDRFAYRWSGGAGASAAHTEFRAKQKRAW